MHKTEAFIKYLVFSLLNETVNHFEADYTISGRGKLHIRRGRQRLHDEIEGLGDTKHMAQVSAQSKH